MNERKKSKTSQEAELDAVRLHLLDCPVVSKDSHAIQVALNALEQERRRMERDLKLQRKFASSKEETTALKPQPTNNPMDKTAAEELADSLNARNQDVVDDDDDDAELMEWQDVTTSPSDNAVDQASSTVPGESVLGRTLAQQSIAAMAQSKTTVDSPLGAIALAIHAALVGDTLQLKCTGIPDDDSSQGFAAPIRELPKGQLVPPAWDVHANSSPRHVNLRYRKDAVGSIVLAVKLDDDDSLVTVELLPSNSREPPQDALTFPLQDHVNLDSLSKALSSQSRVIPALHYKALAVLLTNMCNAFDLGPVEEAGDMTPTATSTPTVALPYVDTTIVQPDQAATTAPIPARTDPYNQFETPTIHVFDHQQRRGDFDSDLMPGAMPDPFQGGNLMGPNHPMFGGSGGGGSGFGMRPRFDPFGPPGGPTDPRFQDDDNNDDTIFDPTNPRHSRPRKPQRPPPGGSGDPNPDHERKPNTLGGNMFG